MGLQGNGGARAGTAADGNVQAIEKTGPGDAGRAGRAGSAGASGCMVNQTLRAEKQSGPQAVVVQKNKTREAFPGRQPPSSLQTKINRSATNQHTRLAELSTTDLQRRRQTTNPTLSRVSLQPQTYKKRTHQNPPHPTHVPPPHQTSRRKRTPAPPSNP